MHLVMFDIDGTLTRTDQVDEVCYVRAVAEELSIRDLNTDWLTYRHVTDSGILRQVVESSYGRPPLPEETDRVLRRFHRLLAEAFQADPGLCQPVDGGPAALSALSALTGQGLALATGGWQPTARLKLGQAGYRAEGTVLASASDACSREEIMQVAQERARASYGVSEFETVTYVGDGLWDLRAAARLGWRFIGIGAGEGAARLRQEGAELVIGDYQGGRFLELISCAQRA